MKKMLTELFQASIIASIIGMPFFFYFMFVMKP